MGNLHSEDPPTTNYEMKSCQRAISDILEDRNFFNQTRLVNKCPQQVAINKQPVHLGCFEHNFSAPLLSLFHREEILLNSPTYCVSLCRSVGLSLAGVHDGTHCWCADALPTLAVSSSKCNSPCPNQISSTIASCGGTSAINVYSTFAVDRKPSALNPQTMSQMQTNVDVRVVYVLFLTGRSWLHIQRMFRMLYHSYHYFYIHVDLKSEYLYTRCLQLAALLPNNVHTTANRRNTIWGSPFLLHSMLDVIKDLLDNFHDWKWDFLINLSETDLPIGPPEDLIRVLNQHRGQIMIKSTSGDKWVFMKSQGLDKAFVQCDNFVWLIGDRPILDGIILNGGSDWLTLPRDFCAYSVHGADDLVTDLKKWFSRTILPLESFFHTLAYNSKFCSRILDVNFRVINWQRPRGCYCRYNTSAQWCGCSPAVFSGARNFYRLHGVRGKTRFDNTTLSVMTFFARKFDSTIDVSMINFVESSLLNRFLPDSPSLNLFLESLLSSEIDLRGAATTIEASVLVYRAMALDALKLLRSVDQKFNNFELDVPKLDAFLLFNASASVSSGMNYTKLNDQLDTWSFLSSSQLSAPLPFRIAAPLPDLVIRLPLRALAHEGRDENEEKYRFGFEALFRLNVQSWVSERHPNSLKLGDVLFFGVGKGFDEKEMIFRSYHHFHSTSDQLSFIVFWLTQNPQQSNSSSEAILSRMPLLVFNLISPTGKFCSVFSINRANGRDVKYPGFERFSLALHEFKSDLLTSCETGHGVFGRWRIKLTGAALSNSSPVAQFSIFPNSVEFKQLPHSISRHIYTSDTFTLRKICTWSTFPVENNSSLHSNFDTCKSYPWSTFFLDLKSTLGYFDSNSGFLKLPSTDLLSKKPRIYSVPI